MTEDKKAHTKASTPAVVPEVSDETLAKLASSDADIRASGTLDIFEQNLPKLGKESLFNPGDPKFIEKAFHAVFGATGGVPRLALYAHQNYGEWLKLYMRLLPETQKAGEGATTVVINNALPVSALDSGQYGDVFDMPEDESEAGDE